MMNFCDMQDKMLTVFDCSLYQLEKNHEEQGNLTYVYNSIHVPFDVKRVFILMIFPVVKLEGLMLIKNAISSL